MIKLTEKAAQAIKELAEERAESGQMMRVFISAGGCSGLEYGMEFAFPGEKDEKLNDHGMDFLVDKKSLERLSGSVVDFDDGLSGKGFEIKNPNASSTCGCGKSFN